MGWSRKLLPIYREHAFQLLNAGCDRPEFLNKLQILWLKSNAYELWKQRTGRQSKILYFHVPKAFGSSFCSLVKSSRKHTIPFVNSDGHRNCWDKPDGPEWCCMP